MNLLGITDFCDLEDEDDDVFQNVRYEDSDPKNYYAGSALYGCSDVFVDYLGRVLLPVEINHDDHDFYFWEGASGYYAFDNDTYTYENRQKDNSVIDILGESADIDESDVWIMQ